MTPKVADFSTHLSGPVASRRLAQFGADVVKVEHPVRGDGNRQFPPMFHEDGVHHLYLNAGTRSLAADPRSAEWPDLVAAVARWADVVVVGNHPENARKLGIDPARLLGINPRLVYCMISAYGLAGDWASLPAHGLNMDAFAGSVPLQWQDGEPDIPERYRSVGTTVAGIEAAMAICAALLRRGDHGPGQMVHVSIWEAAMAWMWRDLATHANLGRPWTPYRDLGTRYAVYAAQDGRALLACPIERRFWESFCDALELPAEVRERGDWSSGVDMGQTYAALGERELIGRHMRRRPRAQWLNLLGQAGIPVAPILDWQEAMDSPHAQENGLMAAYEYRGRTVKVPVPPASITPADQLAEISDTSLAQAHRGKAQGLRRAPYLGEHTDEILRELGLRP